MKKDKKSNKELQSNFNVDETVEDILIRQLQEQKKI